MADKRYVTYTIQAADDDGGELHQRRVAVKTCNMLDYSRQTKMARDAVQWLREQAGYDINTAEDDEMDALDDHIVQVFNLALRFRSRCLAATAGWQERRGDGPWEDVNEPDDWTSIEGFAVNVPAAFCSLWLQAAEDMNPNLWTDSFDEPEKKSGSVSVNW